MTYKELDDIRQRAEAEYNKHINTLVMSRAYNNTNDVAYLAIVEGKLYTVAVILDYDFQKITDDINKQVEELLKNE